MDNNVPAPKPDKNQSSPDGEISSPTADLPGLFPLTKGSTWQYQGEGNEFASFKRQVLFVKGNKAQISENNGGTVSTAVFEVTDEAITRVFFQGEAYDNTNYLDEEPTENIIILKKPLQVGTKWDEQNGNREIVSVDAQAGTPLGNFEDCIKIKISGDNSTVYEYYKDGIGMVKREFRSGDTRVTSSLESYDLKP